MKRQNISHIQNTQKVSLLCESFDDEQGQIDLRNLSYTQNKKKVFPLCESFDDEQGEIDLRNVSHIQNTKKVFLRTTKWLLSCVNHLMMCKVRMICKTFSTFRTGKWFLSCVGSLMDIKF
ncbi:hypothetical protein XELAEV_18001396mg [Xenopus laevis]|nr:hypothetical protein XELAEV_18001396mg [Xenopus laevis]